MQVRFDMYVNREDIRNYLVSLDGDNRVAGVTRNSEDCLLARTVRWKYGERATRVFNDNQFIYLGRDMVVVSAEATEIANRFDRSRDFMSDITRGVLYHEMPDLKKVVSNVTAG